MPDDGRLRLLSFNIQVGISTERYRHYLTRGWQHLLPTRAGDQPEADRRTARRLRPRRPPGSRRRQPAFRLRQSGRALGPVGGVPYWYQQLNRNLGRIAQHSNGLLSRWRPTLLEDHPLPGPPGRGAIFVRFGEGADALVVVMMHLALGARTRTRQLAYIRELIGDYRHQVLMGDMNTHAVDLLENSPLRDLGLMAPQVEATFPSWRPQRNLDHIPLSSDLALERVDVLDQPISDHLPVSVEIRLPDNLRDKALVVRGDAGSPP